MKLENIILLIIAILLYIANRLIVLLAQKDSFLTEILYSKTIYPYIANALNYLHGFLPFSLAEIIFFIMALELTRRLFLFLSKPKQIKNILNLDFAFSFFSKTLFLLSAIALTFQLLWGLNYYRLPLNTQLGIVVRDREVDFLERVLIDLIDETNQLRYELKSSNSGSSLLSQPLKYYYKELPKLYNNKTLLDKLPFLTLNAPAKPIIFSGLMSYTKTSGFYFPFSGEANININVPDYQILATITHEIAHRQGFAREDEANFLAWLVLHESDSLPELKYSGNMLALAYGLNAYHRANPAGYSQLYERLSIGIKSDFKLSREFCDRYEGPVENISESINNQYLQSNQQKDGVKSYGRMIDLVLAYYDRYIFH